MSKLKDCGRKIVEENGKEREREKIKECWDQVNSSSCVAWKVNDGQLQFIETQSNNS